MTILVRRNRFLALSLLFAMPLAAAPAAEPSPGAPAEDDVGAALAREAQTVIETILEYHIDPPTRQEMWLAGTRAVLAKTGVAHQRGLSAEISRLTAPADFAEFANRLCQSEDVRQRLRPPAILQETFIDGVLEALPGGGRLISQKELAVQEQFQGNRYIGTGIALAFDQEKKFPQIAQVIPGGPMERAGGRQGDLILRIDDRDGHRLDIQETVELLRGEEGTSVALVVGDANGKSRPISVIRGPVLLATLGDIRRLPGGDPALWSVKVTEINGSTAHDLRNVERQLRQNGAEGVVLDFRSAQCASLHHAVLLADALLDGGGIGRERTQQGIHEFRADRDCLFRDLPFALLVDRETRGGAEWIAAAVQDNRAGIVVGEVTAGEWQVQSAVRLPATNSALTLTTGLFERPIAAPKPKSADSEPRPGARTTAAHVGIGVTPDHRVASSDRVRAADPFGVFQKTDAPITALRAPVDESAILILAIKALTARINKGNSNAE